MTRHDTTRHDTTRHDTTHAVQHSLRAGKSDEIRSNHINFGKVDRNAVGSNRITIAEFEIIKNHNSKTIVKL